MSNLAQEMLKITNSKKRAIALDDCIEYNKERIKQAAQKGERKCWLSTYIIVDRNYINAEDDLIKFFQSEGFVCKHETEVLGGIRQDPAWCVHW